MGLGQEVEKRSDQIFKRQGGRDTTGMVPCFHAMTGKELDMMTGMEADMGFVAMGMSMGRVEGHLHVNFASRMLLLLLCMVLFCLPRVQHHFISPTSHHLYLKWSQERDLRYVVFYLMFLYHIIVM